jgi:uncharacterized protein
MGLGEYVRNSPDRCYHCKRELFTILRRIANEESLAFVLDGSNTDDRHDFRPGARALRELGVRSPLQELGFGKEDIRRASRLMSLPTSDKPAAACLASRIPYGTPITAEALRAVDEAESVCANSDSGRSGSGRNARSPESSCRTKTWPAPSKKTFASHRGRDAQGRFNYIALDLEATGPAASTRRCSPARKGRTAHESVLLEPKKSIPPARPSCPIREPLISARS